MDHLRRSDRVSQLQLVRNEVIRRRITTQNTVVDTVEYRDMRMGE